MSTKPNKNLWIGAWKLKKKVIWLCIMKPLSPFLPPIEVPVDSFLWLALIIQSSSIGPWTQTD